TATGGKSFACFDVNCRATLRPIGVGRAGLSQGGFTASFATLDRRDPLLRRPHALQVVFLPPVEEIDAVLLLVNIGELGVAVAEHARVIEQRTAELFEARVILLQRFRPVAVAPRGITGLRARIPPDAAEFA